MRSRPNPIRRAQPLRRGTTLVEGLMASVLLATSVVGISGSLVASYQSQTQLQLRREASGAGRKVMDTVTALPMDPAAAGATSLSYYQAPNAGGNASSAPSSTLNLFGIVGVTSSTSNVGVAATTDPVLGGILPGVGVNLIIGGSDASTTTGTSANAGKTPNVLVERRAGLTGATSATGDFALVTVTVPTGGAHKPLQFKRLVTVTEAAANVTK